MILEWQIWGVVLESVVGTNDSSLINPVLWIRPRGLGLCEQDLEVLFLKALSISPTLPIALYRGSYSLPFELGHIWE